MRSSGAKPMSWLLVAWGLFIMVYPFWRALGAAGTANEEVLSAIVSRAFPMGLTALIAGLALLSVLARFEALERRISDESKPRRPLRRPRSHLPGGGA